MKPAFILATVALLVFAWMFRYDVHSIHGGPDSHLFTLRYDRWTGEVYVFVRSDGTWVPFGRGLPEKPAAK